MLAGEGAAVDIATTSGRVVFATFAALAKFDRELIRKRIGTDLAATRARDGRRRKFALAKAKARLALAATRSRDTSVIDLATDLGIKPFSLY